MHFNHKRLVVLRTNFLSKGFGYVVCQPGTDTASKQAMAAYQAGQDFAFMTTDTSAVLQPVAFGSRRCCGNEIGLHSHLDEGFAADWAINKNWHMLFGICFVWVMDCYAVCFILLYNRNNLAILWLQMRLMCWDVDILHQNDTHLTNADYWSRLGKDICFDPYFHDCLQFNHSLHAEFPALTDLPMLLQNMPVGTLDGGYLHKVLLPQAPRIQSSAIVTCATVTTRDSRNTCYLQVPRIPTWSDLVRSRAGCTRSTMLWLAPDWVM
jgi:hypothetical protein